MDGKYVGDAVEVGKNDNALDGKFEGLLLGSSLGRTLGPSLRFELGRKLGSSLDTTLGFVLRSALGLVLGDGTVKAVARFGFTEYRCRKVNGYINRSNYRRGVVKEKNEDRIQSLVQQDHYNIESNIPRHYLSSL